MGNRVPKSSVLPHEESQVVPTPAPEKAPPLYVAATFQADAGMIPVIASPKDFKLSDADRAKGFTHGSRGFYGQGKIVLGGRTYQVSVQLVETHSKG